MISRRGGKPGWSVWGVEGKGVCLVSLSLFVSVCLLLAWPASSSSLPLSRPRPRPRPRPLARSKDACWPIAAPRPSHTVLNDSRIFLSLAPPSLRDLLFLCLPGPARRLGRGGGTHDRRARKDTIVAWTGHAGSLRKGQKGQRKHNTTLPRDWFLGKVQIQTARAPALWPSCVSPHQVTRRGDQVRPSDARRSRSPDIANAP